MDIDINNIEQYQENKKMLFITDDDGIIQFMPLDCAYISDFSYEKIVYKLHYLDLFIPKYKREIENEVSETLKRKGKETRSFIVRFNEQSIKKDLYLNLNILYNKEGELKGFLGEIDGKSEHWENKRLTDEERKNWHLIDNIPLGIYRATIEGDIVFANKAFLNIFQYENIQEIKEINLKELYVDKHFRSKLINDCEKKERYVYECQVYTKNKGLIWVKDEGKLIKDQHGRLIYLDGILEDISSKKAEENKLKELNHSKDKLRSIIPHDLTSPFGQFVSATK